MRAAARAPLQRLAAYAVDVALLAAVLIPLTFAVQAVTGYRAVRTAVKLAPWELAHLAMFAFAAQLGTFDTLQVALLSGVYVLLAVYLVAALRHGGERSIHDLVAGSTVRRAPAV